MTIARLRPPGGWTGGSTVAAAEFEHIDANLAEAIDGRGGTYALTQPLIIGNDNVTISESLGVGQNLTVAGNAEVDGDLEVSGAVDVVGDLAVSANAHVTGTLDVNGAIDVNGAADFASTVTAHGNVGMNGTLSVGGDVNFEAEFDVDGAASFGSTAAFAGNATFSDGVTFNDNIDANGNCFLGGASGFVEFLGTVTAREPVSFDDDGKLVYRHQIVSTDANQTLIAAKVDTFFIPTGVLSTDRQVTIDDTGASDGMRVRCFSRDSANFCTVLRPGGSPAGGSFGGASPNWVEIERIGGVWYLLDPTA